MVLNTTFYREVMGHFITGVAVLTTCSKAGPVGLTVNSFCSVSLEPPLVLVCVDCNSHTLPFFRESGRFVVNILTAQQQDLSRGFATPSEERYRHFCNASYRLTATGSPVIDNVLAFIDARIVSEYPGGDHLILLGQVQTLGMGREVIFDEEAHTSSPDSTPVCHNKGEKQAPLIYYQGQYRRLDDYSDISVHRSLVEGLHV